MEDAKPINFGALADDVLGCIENENTFRSYEPKLRAFLAWLDQKGYTLQDMNVFLINHYFDESGVRDQTPGTQNTHLSVIKNLMRYAYLYDLMPFDVADTFKYQDVIRGDHKARTASTPMTPEQVEIFFQTPAILSRLAARDLAMLSVVFNTLAKPNEVQKLDLRHYDARTNILTFGTDRKKPRIVQISDETKEVLDDHIECNSVMAADDPLFCVIGHSKTPTKERLTSRGMRKAFDRHAEASGLDPKLYGIESLRLSGMAHILNNGGSVTKIRTLTGCKDKRTIADRVQVLKDHGLIEEHPKPENEVSVGQVKETDLAQQTIGDSPSHLAA